MHSHLVERVRRVIIFGASIILLGVAALAFLVSFEAISSFAALSGAVRPELAWAIPPLVDAPIVMASLLWLNRSLLGEQARSAQLVLVLAAGASLGLNLAHAPHHVGAWAVALIAPAALVASVELAMSELRRVIRATNEQVAGGGAAPALPPLPDVDWGPLVTALQTAAADEDGQGLSGTTLSRALAAQGLSVTERDARRVLFVLRPKEGEGTVPAPAPASPAQPPTANGQEPGKELELASTESG